MNGYDKHKLFDDAAACLSPDQWWRRRRVKCRLEKARRQFALPPGILPTLAFVADHEFLLYVFEEMKSKGGQAPGLDGLRYDDLGRGESAAALRAVAKAILAGTYRPHPYRAVKVPKADGGTRELRLRNVIDRVVAGALFRALVPYFEPLFLSSSYGFRASAKMWTAPGQEQEADNEKETFDTWRLLADLEQAVNEEHLCVLVIDDVRKAFDNVRIDDVMAILNKHITDAALLRLIEAVLRGGDDNHNIGIDQGSPLSPLILNILLHDFHDLALDQKEVSARQFRYADNLTYARVTVEQGNEILKTVGEMLQQAGLTLKGRKDGSPVVDLGKAQTAQLLGFSISLQDDKAHFSLGIDAWQKLEKNLREAHGTNNPTVTAGQVMVGWLQAYGPALDNLDQDDTLDRVLHTAADFGFHEDTSLDELKAAWASARKRWGAAGKAARQRHEATAHSDGPAGDPAIAASSAAATPPGAAPAAGGPAAQNALGDGAPPSASPVQTQPSRGPTIVRPRASVAACQSCDLPGGPASAPRSSALSQAGGHAPRRIMARGPPLLGALLRRRRRPS
jgi:hypothetical protein